MTEDVETDVAAKHYYHNHDYTGMKLWFIRRKRRVHKLPAQTLCFSISKIRIYTIFSKECPKTKQSALSLHFTPKITPAIAIP